MIAKDVRDQSSRESRGTVDRDEFAELESLFERARACAPSEQVLAQLLRGVPQRRARRGRLWKAAGVVLATAAAATVAIVTLLPPSQPRAFGLSQVAEAMRKAPIILARSDRGYEVWRSPGHFWAIKHDDLSGVRFLDADRLEAWTYTARRNCIIVSTCGPAHMLLQHQPAQTLDQLIRELEEVEVSLENRWDRTDLESNDGPRIKLTAKRKDQYLEKIVIDGRTGLILHTQSTYERTNYSYPETRPRDIYELGVPPSTRVVDGRASPQLLDLRDEVLAAMRQGFGAYRMIYIETVGGLGAHHVVSDGRRHRCDTIVLSDPSWKLEDLPELARRYWHYDPSTTPPKSVLLFDGDVETRMSLDDDGRPAHRFVCGALPAISWTRTLEHLTWGLRQGFGFFGDWTDRQDEFVGPDGLGRLGCRTRGQANNVSRPWLSERWYDPQHGYALALHRRRGFPEAPWQLDSNWQEQYINDNTSCTLRTPPDAPARGGESEVLEWAELRPGQWYPRLTRSRTLIQTEDGRWVAPQPQRKVRYLTAGEIVELERSEEEAKRRAKPNYRYILAEPLDQVDESWFTIPAEWLKVPASRFSDM